MQPKIDLVESGPQLERITIVLVRARNPSTIGAVARARPFDRLAAGHAPEDVLDDRFVEAFTIAGNADDCLQRARVYGRAGVAELVLTFTGADPVAEIEYLGRALKSR